MRKQRALRNGTVYLVNDVWPIGQFSAAGPLQSNRAPGVGTPFVEVGKMIIAERAQDDVAIQPAAQGYLVGLDDAHATDCSSAAEFLRC